jgi:hypothetical protein
MPCRGKRRIWCDPHFGHTISCDSVPLLETASLVKIGALVLNSSATQQLQIYIKKLRSILDNSA